MKIAVYLPTASLIVGGGEVVTLMQSRYLSMFGHDVSVIHLDTLNPSPYFIEFQQANPQIKYVSLQLPQKISSFEGRALSHQEIHQLYWGLSRTMIDLCYKEKFDIVHNHYSSGNLSVPENTKLLLSLQGVDTKWWYEDHIAVRLADKLTADSESIAKGWNEIYGLNEEIEIMHNGIDEKDFFPLSVKEEIDVFYIGRLIEIKGIQYLCKAISLLKNKYGYKQLNVTIAGKGPYRDDLVRLTQELDIEDFINFIDYLPEEQKNLFYNKSKVCVFPSYAKEGVLTTMLEAASAGRAIITSNCCGMIDFLQNNINGLLTQPEDETELADQLHKLLSDKAKRTKLGLQAREDILSNWTWEKSARRLESIMFKLLENA